MQHEFEGRSGTARRHGPHLGYPGTTMRYAFLGPEGTFCEEALLSFAPDAEGVPCIDVPTALDEVRSGAVEAAVVPIENSVEGGVNATIDSLSHGEYLVIIGEVLVPIQFQLAGHAELHEIRSVGTHPHAYAQCRKWIHQVMPDAVHHPVGSTAAGAKALAEGTADFDAALCSRHSAQKYGLPLIAEDVADNAHAVTRFAVVAKNGRIPAPTGADKTTLLVHLAHNESGGLLDMLEQFAVRGVNLSRIESRPIGDSLGRYAFSIDAEGHITEERMKAVLIGLHRVCPLVRFIGSYPAADAPLTRLAPGTSDADFDAARAWVEGLLES